MAGRLLLGICLRFHNHAPQQLAMRLALHQQAANEVRGNLLGGAGEEGLGESWEVVYGFGSGLGGDGWRLFRERGIMRELHKDRPGRYKEKIRYVDYSQASVIGLDRRGEQA